MLDDLTKRGQAFGEAQWYKGLGEMHDSKLVETTMSPLHRTLRRITVDEVAGSFAKKGVPAAYFDGGTDVIGKPEGWGKEQQEAYEAKHYHQVTDEIRDWWNLEGAIDDFKLLFFLGVHVANQPEMPVWNPGDEFEGARKKALAEVGSSK